MGLSDLGQRALRQLRSLWPWRRRRVSDHPPPAARMSLDQEVMWLREQVRSYNLSSHLRLSPLAENFTEETAEIRQKYLTLLREPMVKASFWQKIWSVAQQDLEVIPNDKRFPIEVEAAEFVKHAIIKSKGGSRGVVESIASGALINGWSLSEKVGKIEEDRPYKGFWSLRELKPKDTRFVNIEIDEFKNVIGIYGTHHNAAVTFDPKDFVIMTYQSLFASPLGISDFRAIYRASTLKEAAIRLRMIYLDKFTGPYMKGRYSTDDQRQYLFNKLKEARAEGVIVLPEGADVEVINLASSAPEQFKSAIDDFDREILIGLRGAHLDMMEGQGNNNRGDTTVQKSMSELTVWMLSESIATVINEQLVPDLVIPNYGRIGMPTVSFGAINPADILRELEIDAKLSEMGVPISLSDVYERARRSPPKDATDTLAPKPAPAPLPLGGGGQLPFQRFIEKFASVHAPSGGVTVQGKEYKGGEFIPGEVLEKATPEERAKIEADPKDKGKGKPEKKPPTTQKRVTEEKPKSAKAERAKAAHKMVDKDIQRYAEEHNEPRFAKAIGGEPLADNEPVDVVVQSGVIAGHGIELKTMVDNSNNKITMKRSAMEKKAAWEKEKGKPLHTVVIDDQQVKDANGPGEHDESKRVIYYRRGYGSFRVGSMHQVKNLDELKRLMALPDDQLPDAAKRPKGQALGKLASE